MGGSNFWILVVDQATKYKWSRFVKFKDEMATTINNIIKMIEKKGNKVRYVRCDNAGENTTIEEEIKENKLTMITMEFTSPRTPE